MGVREAMRIEEECRKIIDAETRRLLDSWDRNHLAERFARFIARKEKEAFDKGYEAGRWDRPTNTIGRI